MTMSKRFLMAVFAVLLGCASLHAVENVLVASSRSNSIEQFSTTGTWIRTFATTGPYEPVAMAQSPLTGEIFVTTQVVNSGGNQLINVILRYQANGHFDTNWDTFAFSCGTYTCGSLQTQSLLFDSSGNLWVATAYGEDLHTPIYIFEYLAANLTLPNPPAQPIAIAANMYRGNQMAFNTSGDLCIVGFIDQDVQCFDTTTGAQTHDYYAEIHAAGISTPEPIGLAFDASNRMYLSDVFTGQVLKEVRAGGPIVVLATVGNSTTLLNDNLVLRGPNLYVPTLYFPPPTGDTPDGIYEVSSGTGAVTNFIVGTAPPGLGNDHIWGAGWMIFYSTTL
jgi:hypothetical protein